MAENKEKPIWEKRALTAEEYKVLTKEINRYKHILETSKKKRVKDKKKIIQDLNRDVLLLLVICGFLILLSIEKVDYPPDLVGLFSR